MTKELEYVYNKTKCLQDDVHTAMAVIGEFGKIAGLDIIKRLEVVDETLDKVKEFMFEAEGLDDENES